MSFGFSAGDFITVGQLAWNVYRVCKQSAERFREVSGEVSSLYMVLKNLEDDAANPNSALNRQGGRRRDELMGMMHNVAVQLEKLQDIVGRYESLGLKEKRVWDRVKFAMEDLTSIQTSINNYVGYINLFLTSLAVSINADSQFRIEAVLQEFMKEIRMHKRAPTLLSAHATDDVDVWRGLERELEEEGISRQEVEEHREAIKRYIKDLIGDLEGTEFEGPDDSDINWDSASVRMAEAGSSHRAEAETQALSIPGSTTARRATHDEDLAFRHWHLGRTLIHQTYSPTGGVHVHSRAHQVPALVSQKSPPSQISAALHEELNPRQQYLLSRGRRYEQRYERCTIL